MSRSAAVAAFAAGDLTALASRFAQSSQLQVSVPAPGHLQMLRDPACGSLLISVGVHGNETAPIELVASLLETLSQDPQQLSVNLLIAIGNPAAIQAGQRFIDTDLNRMFRAQQDSGTASLEAMRARDIMRTTADFFKAARGARWHLDLHTAIRTSFYPAFAILPAVIAPERQSLMRHLLGQAGIAAVIVNPGASGTFSAYTAAHLDALSATVELGQIGSLGENDLTAFSATGNTLAALLRHGLPMRASLPMPARLPIMFDVVQEIIKLSEAFVLHLDDSTPNFTTLQQGTVIASDGHQIYQVNHVSEQVVFPNSKVHIGQRAGLMVVRRPD